MPLTNLDQTWKPNRIKFIAVARMCSIGVRKARWSCRRISGLFLFHTISLEKLMASRILAANSSRVIFEVTSQGYKGGRLTMPAQVLRHLGLDWNESIWLQIQTMDGLPQWSGVLKMQSGPEIDNAALRPHVGCRQRVRVVASRP